MLKSYGATRIPCVVAARTVGAPVPDFLLCLEFVEAGLGGVLPAAYPAGVGAGAVGLVMSKPLASVAAQRFWRVGTQVVHTPVSQVEMGREGAPDGHHHLSRLLLVTGSSTADCFLHLGVSLEKDKRHSKWITHHYSFCELWLRIQFGETKRRRKVCGHGLESEKRSLVSREEDRAAILPDNIFHVQVLMCFLEGCHCVVTCVVAWLLWDTEGWIYIW